MQDRVEYTQFRFYSAFLRPGLELCAYQAALSGIQRLDVVNRVRAGCMTVEFGLAVGLLYAGYGVRALVCAYALNVVAAAIIMGFVVHRFLPKVRLNPFRARRSCVAPMVSLGGRMQLLGIITIMVNNLDNLALTKYGGLAFMGGYAVARRLSRRIVRHQRRQSRFSPAGLVPTPQQARSSRRPSGVAKTSPWLMMLAHCLTRSL